MDRLRATDGERVRRIRLQLRRWQQRTTSAHHVQHARRFLSQPATNTTAATGAAAAATPLRVDRSAVRPGGERRVLVSPQSGQSRAEAQEAQSVRQVDDRARRCHDQQQQTTTKSNNENNNDLFFLVHIAQVALVLIVARASSSSSAAASHHHAAAHI